MAPEFNFIIRPEDNALVENVKTRASANRQALSDRQQSAKLERVVRTKSEEIKTITKKGALRSRQAPAEEEEIAAIPKRKTGFGLLFVDWWSWLRLDGDNRILDMESGTWAINTGIDTKTVNTSLPAERFGWRNGGATSFDELETVNYTSLTGVIDPPVLSSSNGVVFGIHAVKYIRLSAGWTNINQGTLYQHFSVFKYNTRTRSLNINSKTYENAYTAETADSIAIGGTAWLERYEELAFSDDPARPVRLLGYAGDYHLTTTGGNTYANFLAIESIYTPDTYFFSGNRGYLPSLTFKWASTQISYSDTASLKTALDALDTSGDVPEDWTISTAIRNNQLTTLNNAYDAEEARFDRPVPDEVVINPSGTPRTYPAFVSAEYGDPPIYLLVPVT